MNAQTHKDLKIAELLEMMGTTQTMKTSYEFFIANYKKQYPEAPAEFWQKATSLVNYADLMKRIIPVYSKHFTEQEIDDLIKFYNSSTGKTMIEKMPMILQESMMLGQEWGIELAQKIEKEISATEEKVYTPPPPPMR